MGSSNRCLSVLALAASPDPVRAKIFVLMKDDPKENA
jgi:hypothetical protein